ncbi:MAG: T9SS type A sorting domain-containing protein, partial [Melioribacteraceae bacterium]
PKDYSFVDKNLQVGKLQYRLKQIDLDGVFEYSDVVEVNFNAPVNFVLGQNYPNPFNPETVISYQLPVGGLVTLKVYDLLGREIATLVNEYKTAGTYNSQFSIRNFQLPSGVYFYTLKAGNYLQAKKMLVIK